MATTSEVPANNDSGYSKEYNGQEHHHVSHVGDSGRLPAFGGEFQPGPYHPGHRKLANPAPLGLSAFALTTFILSLINMQTHGIATNNIVVGSAYAYGGLVQLLAGMWEMAVGNTFGATALSSYGGFWISFAVIETSSFGITTAYKDGNQLNVAIGFYLIAWFIFTTLLLLCTLRSSVAFFLLFFTLDIAFLLLAIGHFYPKGGKASAPWIKAGGFFGLLAAFLAWYNAFAVFANNSNFFFVPGVMHFPWSDKGRAMKEDRATV